MPLEPSFPGGPVHVTGYPGAAGGNEMADLTTSAQRLPNLSDLFLSSWESVGEGMSGGPLWHVGASGQPHCVGVVSTAAHNGEITPELLKAIQGWEAEDHARVKAGAPATATGVSVPTPAAAGVPGSRPALDALEGAAGERRATRHDQRSPGPGGWPFPGGRQHSRVGPRPDRRRRHVHA